MTAATCIANLVMTANRIDRDARAAAKETADEVMQESKEKHCPVDTGELKESGKVEIVKNTLTEFHARLSYSTPYAVYVHEIPYHHTHGSWKYLSIPFNKASSTFLQRIASRVSM